MTTMVGRPAMKTRIGAAAIAVLVQGLLALALFYGLLVRPPLTIGGDTIFTLSPQPVPHRPDPPVPPRPAVKARHKNAAAPPNRTAVPTEIVAPPPIVLAVTPPLIVAPVAGPGSEASSGAATVAGPGTGAGAYGNGRGGGGYGDDDGTGETPPHHRSGRLKDSDYPRGAADTGAGGTVSVRYVVATSGRVTDCAVTRSSGNAELDEATCRLIVQRFRFDPSRDSHGRPVESIIVENHSWAPEPGPGRG